MNIEECSAAWRKQFDKAQGKMFRDENKYITKT